MRDSPLSHLPPIVLGLIGMVLLLAEGDLDGGELFVVLLPVFAAVIAMVLGGHGARGRGDAGTERRFDAAAARYANGAPRGALPPCRACGMPVAAGAAECVFCHAQNPAA